MGKTSIEWTDYSWNPIRARHVNGDGKARLGWHCEHVSEGCRFCYSETFNRRLGTGLGYKPSHRNDVEIFLDEKMLKAPLQWKVGRRVFVCSMTDLFAEFVPDAMIDRMFAVMALAPRHTFQILTKRPERMRVLMPKILNEPLPNVWLGTSVEDQPSVDARIPELEATPAAVRFLSVEPLLAPIDLHRKLSRISMVIVGGESGQGARQFHTEWAEDIILQCRAAGVACFVKQVGAHVMTNGKRQVLEDKKGGNPSEWPPSIRVRDFLEVRIWGGADDAA